MSLKKIKYISIAVTFCLILVSAIIFRQNPLLTVPLFISLFVMSLQADVNRYSYLVGSLNSLIYAAVYAYLGIYGSLASALLFSFPFQLVTFFNWKKHAYKQAVVFKKMSVKLRILLIAVFLAVWAVYFAFLSGMGSKFVLLDSVHSLLGMLVSVLSLLAFIEFTYLNIVNGILAIVLNLLIALGNHAQFTYLIYSVYSYFCLLLGFINVRKLYKEQQKGR